MKVTFIRPNMFNTKSYDAMQPLAISVLAALTPKDIEIEFFDDRIEELPEKFDTDIIAISVETFTARRAYQISSKIRKMDIPVILGGIHPTIMPDEALRFCDVVVIGEAEGIWAEVMNDAKNGNLKKIYIQNSKPFLKGIRFDRDIFKNKKYVPLVPVQFGRGCKNSCEFCSVHAFFGNSLRQRPVEEVVREIASTNVKNLFIVDDNIFVDEYNTKKLLEALIPLKIRWSSQASIDIVNNPELLRLLEKSGCISLIIGFETMDERNLKLMGKGVNLTNKDYEDAVKKLADHGIMVYGTFIIGYDFDTKDTFDTVFEFAVKNKLMLANFNPLIPMPGTRLYDRMYKEGRLIYDRWWIDSQYRYGQAVFHPKGMSSQELSEGCYSLRVNFNKYSSIMKRLFNFKNNCSTIYNAGVFLAANLISKKEILKKQSAMLGDNSISLD